MQEKSAVRTCEVALAGAPNVGKSTVFNLLTGLSQHVGNWPGKTIEQKTGTLRANDMVMNIVDLPGTYSLTANSAEELIARDYLVQQHPDVVVAVLNAASLERNLYLVAELIELAPRLVIALNMIDVAQQHGHKIDYKTLEATLNIPVVPIIANKNQGLRDLVSTIEREYNLPSGSRDVKHIEYGSEIKKVIDRLENLLNDEIAAPYPKHWAAMKLLEGDPQINRMIKERVSASQWQRLDALLRENESAAVTIAELRFEWVGKMIATAQEKPSFGQVSFTEKIDRYATHPVLGLLLLIIVLGAIFLFVYSIGVPIQQFLGLNLVERGRQAIYEIAFMPLWLKGLLGDGILSGVGTVLTFIPILFFFFVAVVLSTIAGVLGFSDSFTKA